MMNLAQRITRRLRQEIFSRHYRRSAAAILGTPPVQPGNTPFTMLSMVHTRDVVSYLAAAKSFAHYTRPRRIVVVCDPSITAQDRATLRAHIPCIELLDALDYTDPAIPRGGCWERLSAISQLSAQDYIVQLDADTLTLAPPTEVLEAIHTGSGFVIGEEPDQHAVDFPAAARAIAPHVKKPGAHIQALSEDALPHIGLPAHSLYVRGCAGFTGFPPAADMRERLLDFSRRMSARLGEDNWKRWGTEQVSSNYLAANAPGFRVLPFPKYATPDQRTGETVFLHYIGSLRFQSPAYAQDTRQFIASYA